MGNYFKNYNPNLFSMEKHDKTLWEEFSLAENNPDPGAGILYCLKYSEDRIKAHREAVIKVLKGLGIEMEEIEEGVAVIPAHKPDDSESRKLLILLEELSCLNEAQEYKEAGLKDVHTIPQLTEALTSLYYKLLGERRMADAYNLVDVSIPQIVRDLSIAQEQNGVLSKTDKDALMELETFAKRVTERLAGSNRLVVFGAN